MDSLLPGKLFTVLRAKLWCMAVCPYLPPRISQAILATMIRSSINTIWLGAFLVLNILVATTSVACPKINEIPDFNCDEALTITVLGDSLAYGIGDVPSKIKRGYPFRIAKKFPLATINNLGESGKHASALLIDLNQKLKPGAQNSLKDAIFSSDIVILDIGRNDRWNFKPALNTWRDLKKSAAIIRSRSEEAQGYSPIVVTAVLMLPNRGSQGPWVKELNSIILKTKNKYNPTNLRFDLVSKKLLTPDQIHPTSKGYDELAKVLSKYLRKTLPALMLKMYPDQDGDGIANVFETIKFGTDPALPDTDGDLFNDSEEIFVHGSDPLIAELP